jgi:glyoxylase-like metal-dependent hydrolase (beta-lactamase superfamily II)
MFVKTIPVGELETNCYVVALSDAPDSPAIIIDPGAESEKIKLFLDKSCLKPIKIVLTHSHYDHIGGAKKLRDALKIQIAIHALDAPFLENPMANFSAMFGEECSFSADELLNDGDKIQLGDLILEIIHTPGHTEGGISIKAGSDPVRLFCGDLIFKMGIGRTDFPGGNYEVLVNSIKRLLDFPNDTILYPGHGPKTTLASERGFLRGLK